MAVVGGVFRCPVCSEPVVVPGEPVDYVSDEEREEIARRVRSAEGVAARVESLVGCLGRLALAGLLPSLITSAERSSRY